MKLTKFEGTMEIKGAQVTVEFADGELRMRGVPAEWAAALATHVGRFRPKMTREERLAAKAKKGGKSGANGAHKPAEASAAKLSAPPAPTEAKRHTKPEVQEAARSVPKHDDAGSEPHVVSAPKGDRVAAAKQVSEIVEALIEDSGFSDVDKLVAECQRLQGEGHPALSRVTNLDDRVRRRAILAGLEA